jgi:hypothetical protein
LIKPQCSTPLVGVAIVLSAVEIYATATCGVSELAGPAYDGPACGPPAWPETSQSKKLHLEGVVWLKLADELRVAMPVTVRSRA